MKKTSFLLLAVLFGCGEGAPPEMTPEKKAEMDAKMSSDMSNMMQSMQSAAPPGTKKPK